MITFEAFLEEDFDRLISWIKSEEELIQFAGSIFRFPLTREQLTVYLNNITRQVFKIKLIATNEIIGHCELNFQNASPRLSRILIGDANNRNKGLGKAIVKEMLDKLFFNPQFNEADLNVFDWNSNAIASYKKSGFVINTGHDSQMIVNEKKWNAVNMTISKKDFIANNIIS